MPPKGIVPNLFGERKVFIKRIDGDGDWHEIDGVVKDAIIVKEEMSLPEFINSTGTITATFKLMFDFKIGNKRKTTYKTLRHDCAKRNGRR